MRQQIQDLKGKVEKSQQALVDYKRQNLIVNVGDKQTINDQKVEQLNKEYTSARADRVQKESLYDLAQSHGGQVGIIVQDSILQHLEEKYSDLKASSLMPWANTDLISPKLFDCVIRSRKCNPSWIARVRQQ